MVVAIDWPVLFLVGAIIFDIVMYQAHKHDWSARKMLPLLAISTLLGFLPMPLLYPPYPVYLIIRFGIVSFILSLLVGFAGGYIRAWLGRRTGKVIETLEQRKRRKTPASSSVCSEEATELANSRRITLPIRGGVKIAVTSRKVAMEKPRCLIEGNAFPHLASSISVRKYF